MMMNIYVTNLGKYNEGFLIGQWVNLPVDPEQLQKVYNEIGINEYYEEMFITDYETDVPGLEIGEYDNINDLNKLAEQLNDLQDYEQEEISALMEAFGHTLEEAIAAQEEGNYIYYSGYTLAELADMLADEQIACLTADHKVPEFFTQYFDYEAFARDLAFDYTETTNGCISSY